MPSWGEILREIARTPVPQPSPGAPSPGAPSAFDIVRRKYLAAVHGETGRAVIAYATRWTMPIAGTPVSPSSLSIVPGGVRLVPAQAILEQFERAKIECQDPSKLRAWVPMLAQFGPDLLVTCQNANILSENLVSDWLGKYMLRNEPNAGQQAASIAKWLLDHKHHKTHGRPISRTEARSRGLKVIDLESNQRLQDAVLSAYHAITQSFAGTNLAKVIENHLGKAFLELVSQSVSLMPPVMFPFPAPGQPAPGGKARRR